MSQYTSKKFIFTILSLLLFCSLGVQCEKKEQSESVPLALTPLEDFFSPDSQPFAFILPEIQPVAGVNGYKAADCGVCHKEIYAEWQRSTHAHAVKDLQFFAEISKADSPKWLCLNCHIPVANQRDSLVIGLRNANILMPQLKENTAFDSSFMMEGVSCATCHIRTDSTGSSTIIGTHNRKTAPHPVTADPALLNSICDRCHNPQGEQITPNLLCWFTTQKEMIEGPHPITQKACISCHMPPKSRRLAERFTHLEKRAVATHSIIGSGIPKWFDTFSDKKEFISSLKILSHFSDSIHLTLINTNKGHSLPTADPERYLHVLTAQFDSTQTLIQKDTIRIGQTWKWNPAEKLGDNRLAADESRGFTFSLNPKSTHVTIKAWHVRLNPEFVPFMKTTKWHTMFGFSDTLMTTMERHYPLARLLYHETTHLFTNESTLLDASALIDLSVAEQNVPLAEREY